MQVAVAYLVYCTDTETVKATHKF